MVEIIVRRKQAKLPEVMTPEEVMERKKWIDSITLLYPTNSYILDYAQRRFSINGGRYIEFPETVFADRSDLVFVQRNTMDLGADGTIDEAYLMGWSTKFSDGSVKEVILYVSPDGRSFKFLNDRRED